MHPHPEMLLDMGGGGISLSNRQLFKMGKLSKIKDTRRGPGQLGQLAQNLCFTTNMQDPRAPKRLIEIRSSSTANALRGEMKQELMM